MIAIHIIQIQSIQIQEEIETMIERRRISKEIHPQDEKEMIETEFGIETEVEAPDLVIVKMLGVNRPEVQETWDQIE